MNQPAGVAGHEAWPPLEELYRTETVSVVTSRDGIAAAREELYRTETVSVVTSRDSIA